jgi:hypothetical protein
VYSVLSLLVSPPFLFAVAVAANNAGPIAKMPAFVFVVIKSAGLAWRLSCVSQAEIVGFAFIFPRL